MKKFLIGLVTGVVLAGVAVVILFFAAVRLGAGRPSVAQNSTLLLRLEGEIAEQPGVEIPFGPFASHAPVTVRETWIMLRRAAADNRIKALLLMPKGVGAGWGKLQEIREGILEFKKSGKPVYAWLRTPTNREYYLATAADRIYLAPEDVLDVKGLRAELLFAKNALDKLGVKVEIEHAGKYKDAGDMFTRTSMTPETREVMNSVLDRLYAHLADVIGSSRRKTPEQVKALIDQGPFLANQAKNAGLIDGVLYEDEVYGELARKLRQTELTKIGHRQYLKAIGPGNGKNRVAFVVGQGAIARGEADELQTDGIYSDSFIKLLRQVAGDSSIKGVILRIDSPGGDAIASDDILREVRLLSKKKPLVVSMSDVAASGGYYIAMSGDPIVSYPNTFTGSIGVIYGKVNLRGLYDKIGVQKEIMTRGRNAAIDSDYQPLDQASREKLRESIYSIYDGFLKRVSEGRKRPYEEVAEVAEGRVWLGSQAKENGLIDELGGLNRAVELIKAKARIPKDEAVCLVPFPRRRNFFDALFNTSAASAFDSQVRKILAAAGLEALHRSEVMMWLRGGMLRAMPYSIDIH